MSCSRQRARQLHFRRLADLSARAVICVCLWQRDLAAPSDIGGWPALRAVGPVCAVVSVCWDEVAGRVDVCVCGCAHEHVHACTSAL